MKKNTPDRVVTQTGVAASAHFGLSLKDSAHLVSLLRDTIYSDKVLAVLREYSANAWDANRMAGNGHMPIRVHVPTYNEPTLTIRDFGPGLSEEDVFTVYTQYGASTKRTTNDAVGSLGIGSKSAFAYSDAFTVSSWFDGTKKVYIAVLDPTNIGTMSKVHEEPSDEPNGVEISVAVRTADIHAFETRAVRLFAHFEPRPEVNIVLPPVESSVTRLENGTLRVADDEDANWVAVMGCIPYRVDLAQLPVARLNRCLKHLTGSIKFDIGEVEFSASREELKYSDATKDKLINKFDALVDEYVLRTLDVMDKPDVSDWDKRLRVRVLTDLDIVVPEAFEAYGAARIALIPDPTAATISVIHNKSAVGSVTFTPELRIVLNDTGKNLRGYSLRTDDYVIRALNKKLDLEAEVTQVLTRTKLMGVPVLRLSELAWTPRTTRRSSSTVNTKHKQFLFVLDPTKTGEARKPYSSLWTAQEVIPSPDDVFVTLENFIHSTKGLVFFRDYRDDASLAASLGLTMPTVYGHKSTVKRPIAADTVVGVEYYVWRERFAKEIESKFGHLLQAAVDLGACRRHTFAWPTPPLRKQILESLGEEHDISRLILTEHHASTLLKGKDPGTMLRIAKKFTYQSAFEAETLWDSITERYPLLKGVGGYSAPHYLWDKDLIPSWTRYVKLVDKDDAKIQVDPITKPLDQETNSDDSVHAN